MPHHSSALNILVYLRIEALESGFTGHLLIGPLSSAAFDHTVDPNPSTRV